MGGMQSTLMANQSEEARCPTLGRDSGVAGIWVLHQIPIHRGPMGHGGLAIWPWSIPSLQVQGPRRRHRYEQSDGAHHPESTRSEFRNKSKFLCLVYVAYF